MNRTYPYGHTITQHIHTLFLPVDRRREVGVAVGPVLRHDVHVPQRFLRHEPPQLVRLCVVGVVARFVEPVC